MDKNNFTCEGARQETLELIGLLQHKIDEMAEIRKRLRRPNLRYYFKGCEYTPALRGIEAILWFINSDLLRCIDDLKKEIRDNSKPG